MSKRIDIAAIEPSIYKGMFGLESAVANSGLNKTHLELIKIRASQINGCAFCINMHTTDAIKQGEMAQRIFLLNAWEEKVVLAVTEEVTLISQNGLSEETYQKAIATFGENYVAKIIMAVVAINAWNRIAVSTHKPVG